MAITLDGLVRNPTAGQKAGVPATTKADLATGAFDLASKSLGQQVDATSVQLSPFGQIKSSFVDVQSAGRTLATPAKTSTVEDVTKAVQSFSDAINNATKIVNSAANSTAALAGNGSSNSASLSLNSIVASGGNTADLKNIGVSVNQDGTLSVDTKALQSAMQANPNSVQNTLAKVGAQAVLVSQKELTSTGNTNNSTVNPLSARSKNLSSKTAVQQKVTTDAQTSTQQQEAGISSNAADGIAAYNEVFR